MYLVNGHIALVYGLAEGLFNTAEFKIIRQGVVLYSRLILGFVP